MARKPRPAGPRRKPFASEAPRASKARRGRTDVDETPLAIRTFGVDLPDALAPYVRAKLGARLGKFAPAIVRVSVRFVDVNGPRGGVDTECRVQAVLTGLPTALATERAGDPRRALDAAARVIERNVARVLERADGGSTARRERGRRKPAAAKAPRAGRGGGSSRAGRG